jgi:hypothetical protein
MKLLKKDEKHDKKLQSRSKLLVIQSTNCKKNCDWTQKNLRENVRF